MVVKRNGQPRRISHVSELPSDPCDPDGADKGESETTYSFPRQSVTWPSDVNNPTRTKRLCGSPRGDPRSPHTLLIFYFLVPRFVLSIRLSHPQNSFHLTCPRFEVPYSSTDALRINSLDCWSRTVEGIGEGQVG